MTAVSHELASSRSKSLDHNNGEDAHMLDTGKLYNIIIWIHLIFSGQKKCFVAVKCLKYYKLFQEFAQISVLFFLWESNRCWPTIEILIIWNEYMTIMYVFRIVSHIYKQIFVLLKFIYSEKGTKFDKVSILFLMLLTYVRFISYSKCSNWLRIWKLSSNFGCFFTVSYSAWTN